MNSIRQLHPLCSFAYFAVVIVLLLICRNPVVMLEACAGAVFCLGMLSGRTGLRRWKGMLPVFLMIAVFNLLVNHRGITKLFTLGGQWVTLEAIGYGVTAGLSLSALILWFACYQEVITSDKFLYLFGKAAPGTALLISMALGLVPRLEHQLHQIEECQEMLYPDSASVKAKVKKSLRHVSTLLGWSLENTVEQADSMKARGYGIRKRTCFHLFRFESGDGVFLAVLFALTSGCLGGRIAGYGIMEFYPQMDALFQSPWEMGFYFLFLILMLLPGILEWKEELLWRSYNLTT